ncbi:imidazole glycerol phosphate synthase subunit HisH [Lentiprolixibacter aurantiacus]|uniref:Imidazole glycerol phosphate synthase subunit HisH n=1 Tax=Lentiprolixibacter aurantiacus TaxID=2993939 RepID=A0AAE3SNU4_9FLAO|nr:imidazole glycerol phosphate synthase subunit HisH [Lentiprolixibacter aurantiacus]MCX2719551.1 imidazole glycerol phosphate synthase subunit HisH [Lentiprolixibacter aurantiacus]
MNIAIIDYGAGNIQSIKFAFARLGFKAELTADVDTIKNADKIIFPGVGEASSAMEKLKQSRLDRIIPELTQPVLGICLGMQLMCNYSEEGHTQGLGIFNTEVRKFNHGVKVPQIGWNQISDLKSDLFEGIPEKAFIYLVHSYYAPLCKDTIAVSDYGLSYSSALKSRNFYGVQFHPEKSSTIGAKILQNFIDL